MAVGLAAALWLAWRAGLFGLHDRVALVAAIERARAVPFIAALFVATYACAAAIGVPATPLTLAGGALFGIPNGIALNWVGEMLAALLAFAVTRATGLRARGTTAPASVAAGDSTTALSSPRGRATLFRLRLIPVVPFALLNAGAAVAGMSWRDYILATGAGIIPITVIYTISASELVAGVAGSGARAFTTALIAAAVLVAITFLPALVGRIRNR